MRQAVSTRAGTLVLTLVAAAGSPQSGQPRGIREAPSDRPPNAGGAEAARPSADSGLSRRPRILIQVHDRPRAFPPANARMVADSVPEAEFIMAPEESLTTRIADVDALIGTPRAAMLKRAGPRLKWIQVHDGGVDRYVNLFPQLAQRGITLTDAKIVKGPEMADHALALLLGLTRQIDRSITNQAREEWSQKGFAPVELRGRTALIVGLGGAGTQIAERAFAFGMRVLATDPKDIPYMRAVERVEKPDMLRQLLPMADVVFMAAPYTRETKNLFGSREFAAMKRGVYFINISRGGTVDTDALVSALTVGQVAGAGLDVVNPEPLPKGHLLWRMKNVIITPHLAGNSDHGITRRTALFIENSRRFVRGQPLRNVVDLTLGY
jgi:phosphoglycerate dehydrogenase-like enzyme